jgi:hypothetical protein
MKDPERLRVVAFGIGRAISLSSRLNTGYTKLSEEVSGYDHVGDIV